VREWGRCGDRTETTYGFILHDHFCFSMFKSTIKHNHPICVTPQRPLSRPRRDRETIRRTSFLFRHPERRKNVRYHREENFKILTVKINVI